jgi:hypothetical protein
MQAVSLASEIRAAYESLSPYIESQTQSVCPSCEKVCCIDRHAVPEPDDKVFFEVLAKEDPSASIPAASAKQSDTEPCRHLGPGGCGLERWQRPFRCTWYFCDALLEQMPHSDARAYRAFVAGLGKLVELRAGLLESESARFSIARNRR